ncbi:hypothetical protein F152LOC_02514 [Pectobacterium brasiliense]|nr:hypothetical protein F152LOC_02514 [Pectobacterium brasiliense]
MHQLCRLYVNRAIIINYSCSLFIPARRLSIASCYFLLDYSAAFYSISLDFHLLCYALRIPCSGASFSGKSVTLTQQSLIKMRRQ